MVVFPEDFRPVDFGDAAAWDAADTQCKIKGERTGWDGVDRHFVRIAQPHDGTISVAFHDITERPYQAWRGDRRPLNHWKQDRISWPYSSSLHVSYPEYSTDVRYVKGFNGIMVLLLVLQAWRNCTMRIQKIGSRSPVRAESVYPQDDYNQHIAR